jgi:hypothetical protein
MASRNGRKMFTVAVVVIVLIVGVSIATVVYLDHLAQERCDGQVKARDDNRAMWLWLTGRFPGDELAGEALEQLDILLPRLMCVNNVAIPIPNPGGTP